MIATSSFVKPWRDNIGLINMTMVALVPVLFMRPLCIHLPPASRINMNKQQEEATIYVRSSYLGAASKKRDAHRCLSRSRPSEIVGNALVWTRGYIVAYQGMDGLKRTEYPYAGHRC